jgi:hypothetical protein
MEREQGLRDLASDIETVQTALLEAARSEPTRWWTAPELEHETKHRWPSPVFMIALYDLLDQHRLELDRRLRVRLHP